LVVARIVLFEEQDEELMEVDPTLFGPSLWNRKKETMNEEVNRVAGKKMSYHGRREHGNASNLIWTEDVALKSVEVGLD
jgi:hypothetical protein